MSAIERLGMAAGGVAMLGAVLFGAPLAALAQQASGAAPGFQLSDSNEPIEIESDRLEVRDRDRMAVFTGNVNLVQGKLNLKTVRMTVHYAQGAAAPAAGAAPAAPAAQPASTGSGLGGSTNIERMEAEGRVYIKQGEQVATGDNGTFDMKSGVMVLTGKEVVLTEGPNVVVGCRLTMFMKSGETKLDGCGGAPAKGGGQPSGGRIKMLLQPGSQTR